MRLLLIVLIICLAVIHQSALAQPHLGGVDFGILTDWVACNTTNDCRVYYDGSGRKVPGNIQHAADIQHYICQRANADVVGSCPPSPSLISPNDDTAICMQGTCVLTRY